VDEESTMDIGLLYAYGAHQRHTIERVKLAVLIVTHDEDDVRSSRGDIIG
jgi:hypothetical protein